MSTEDYNIELVDQYLSGDLDTINAANFELQLKKDSKLRGFVEAQQNIITELKVDAFSQDVKSYLNSRRSTRTVSFSPWGLTGIAASVVLVISIAYFSNPKESLFDLYFVPYPNLISNRATADDSDAMYYYSNGNFELAIVAFDKKKGLSDQEKLYLGISYLSVHKIDQATTIFTELLSTDRASYANWYLSLCYLKIDRHKKAMEYLRAIEKDGYNYPKASLLLEELKD